MTILPHIYFITIGSDETKIKYLKKSVEIKNIDMKYIIIKWRGFVDKIKYMIECIKDYNDNDIVCFVDAYDIIVSNVEDIYNRFIKYNCNILFSSEFICFPYSNIEGYTNINSKTNFKYLNSGGYIGYKKNIYEMLKYRTLEEIYILCKNGGDQNFFTQYYLNNKINNEINIKLDTNQEIFQSMCCVNFYDFELHNGYVYNKILEIYPCFIHFNGFGDNDIKNAIYKHKYINIIEEFLQRLIMSINGDVISLPYEQFDNKYINQIS
jgi:hypothetical protein